jgi:hypothetical protein
MHPIPILSQTRPLDIPHRSDAGAAPKACYCPNQPREDCHPAPDQGHGRADRQAGVRIVRADGRGDRDCEKASK